ncbi:MAG TPA: ribonuclease HI family protein [Terriglobales bacterium]|jgi:ribonuclease HI
MNASSGELFGARDGTRPDHYLIAYSDGGARGNPGPAGYGVVIQDESGRKVAQLSQYLGHQTNNVAEYQGLIAALEYAADHEFKALKVISDSELLVKQIRGEYKVNNPTLKDLHGRARQLIRQLNWFNIQHVLRGKNRDADRLANEAMDKGMGRPFTSRSDQTSSAQLKEFEGVVRNGVIELSDATLPEGTRVQVRVKR